MSGRRSRPHGDVEHTVERRSKCVKSVQEQFAGKPGQQREKNRSNEENNGTLGPMDSDKPHQKKEHDDILDRKEVRRKLEVSERSRHEIQLLRHGVFRDTKSFVE